MDDMCTVTAQEAKHETPSQSLFKVRPLNLCETIGSHKQPPRDWNPLWLVSARRAFDIRAFALAESALSHVSNIRQGHRSGGSNYRLRHQSATSDSQQVTGNPQKGEQTLQPEPPQAQWFRASKTLWSKNSAIRHLRRFLASISIGCVSIVTYKWMRRAFGKNTGYVPALELAGPIRNYTGS
ncbi:hypothetical protein PWR63_28915 [Paraburkholderia sp. A2WS-5]|uniref:hypothetical protein n=1 Tax=unclassified Paraburkholderia TaxID=2615204 RepID=UPI003B7F4A63